MSKPIPKPLRAEEILATVAARYSAAVINGEINGFSSFSNKWCHYFFSGEN
jgi:hypothetical protein